MNISFECVQCEADFELDVWSLIRDPSQVICPNCESKADPEIIETAMTAMDEVLTQFARLQRRFRVGWSVEPDEFADELADHYPEDDDEGLWSDEPEEEEEED